MQLRTRHTFMPALTLAAALILTACAAPTPSPTLTPPPTSTPAPTVTPLPTPSPTPYHPGGPDIISLYENRQLIKDEFTTTWVTGKDIGVFYAYPMREPSVAKLPYMDLFKKYWNTDLFPNADDYKIGYGLTFTLKSSEVFSMTIRLPKDCPKDPKAYFYPFIEVYVYDNLHRIPGPTFYHLEESSTYPNTIMTSIKLTAGTKSSEVVSARLTAFVFKDDSDFDPVSGDYIGKTSYTIDVLKNK